MKFLFFLFRVMKQAKGEGLPLSEGADRAAGKSVVELAGALRIRHLGLAFLWACVLLTFRSSVLLCSCIDTLSFATLVVMAGLACQSLVMVSIAALASRNPGLIDRLPAWPFVGAALVGLAVMSLVGHVGQQGSQVASIVGSVCAGCGYGYLCGMWGQVYGHMHPSRTSFYLPLVFLLTLVIFFVVTTVSEALGVQATLLMLPLPVAALWCLRSNANDHDIRETSLEGRGGVGVAYLGAFKAVWRVLFGAAIFSFMFGFVWQLAVAAVGSVDLAHRMPLAMSLVVGLAYAALVIFGRRKISLSMVYGLTAPVFIVVFALLPLFWSQNPLALYGAVSAGFSIVDIVVWCMVVESAYDYRVSGFVMNGIVRGVMLLVQLAGILLGYLFSITPDQPPTIIVAVSIVTVYFVGLWFFMARRRGPALLEDAGVDGEAEGERVASGSAAGALGVAGVANAAAVSLAGSAGEGVEGAAAEEEAFLARIDRVVAHYHLTRRESEVLPYLARGRSAKVIAEALFVSENTVRSHIARIFDKTDLHSKQELIDLVESF